jgi:nicotinamide-nucleotide amidase
MKAEILTIGDELLIGQVVDTNSAWIGQQMNLIGIRIERITSISDNASEIVTNLRDALKRSDVVLVTGGLGPTRDDITKPSLCEFFNTKLVFNPEAYNDIEAFFKRKGLVITELNRQQAFLPESCVSIPNPIGTARGMWFEANERIVVSMPGVPFEMKGMMADYVLPKLAKLAGNQAIVHKTIMTTGIGESFLAARIETWENQLPENMKLAYLPSPGIVRLRITATGSDFDLLKQAVDDEVERLIPLASDYIYGYDDEQLEYVIGQLLKQKEASLSTAESCTGGYVSHLITSVPGSSVYFMGSVVSYSNQVKMNQLGVTYSSFVQHGAVSKQVVEQMALGANRLLQTDYAIAISGIAGPDGGTDEKPVGLVWIAIAGPKGVQSQEFMFGDDRDRNIRRAGLAALNMLRKILLKL